jgi:hypothetical protein
MKLTIKIAIATILIALMVAVAFLSPAPSVATGSSTGANTGWATNSNPKVTFGITGGSSRIDFSRLLDLRNTLVWPIVKTVTPNPARSGQTSVKFDLYFEYPFPGTTANIADTLPSGYVLTGPYYIDGTTPITPTRKTSNFVEFDRVPSPSAISPTGVRHITFYATAPKVSRSTTGTDTATAQFFVNGARYGPSFFYNLLVTTSP